MSAKCNYLLPLAEAGEELGVNPCTFYDKQYEKYTEFIHEVDGVKMMDVIGFKDKQAKKSELLHRVRQFVSYMHEEEGETYSKIATVSEADHQSISKLEFGYDIALKILLWYAKNDRFAIVRFDKFYGWDFKLKTRSK